MIKSEIIPRKERIFNLRLIDSATYLKFFNQNMTPIKFKVSQDSDRFVEYLPLIDINIKSHDNDLIKRYSALIDTGANTSYIDHQVAIAIKSYFYGTIKTSGITNHTHIVNTTLVDLNTFAMEDFWLEKLIVGVSEITSNDFKIILGRDFLQYFKFTYNGYEQLLDMEYIPN